MSANQDIISLADPVLGEQEKQALVEVIDSGWLTMGERVGAFEQAFAELHGMGGAVAVSSCTAGLHLSLCALGVKEGDEVLVPSLTFVSAVNAVLHVGASPVFVDIEQPDVPHVCAADAKRKCTARTKAAMIMHYGGYAMDLPRWRALADDNGLKLIEDAAHAPAVDQVGRFGDATAFSFFSNKNMSTAEGGMVFARDEAVLSKVRQLRSHGMTTGTLDRHRGHAYSYDVPIIGYNYRLDELRAAMGLVQLARVKQWNARRRELSNHYRALLAERLPEVTVPFTAQWKTAGHLLPILLPENVDRTKVMAHLRQAGIQSSIHYPPAHQFTYYSERFPSTPLPNTEAFCARELTLPLHPALSESDVDRVVASLSAAVSA